jgi:hypothetical protein
VNVTLDFRDAVVVDEPSFFGLDRLATHSTDDGLGLAEEH